MVVWGKGRDGWVCGGSRREWGSGGWRVESGTGRWRGCRRVGLTLQQLLFRRPGRAPRAQQGTWHGMQSVNLVWAHYGKRPTWGVATRHIVRHPFSLNAAQPRAEAQLGAPFAAVFTWQDVKHRHTVVHSQVVMRRVQLGWHPAATRGHQRVQGMLAAWHCHTCPPMPLRSSQRAADGAGAYPQRAHSRRGLPLQPCVCAASAASAAKAYLTRKPVSTTSSRLLSVSPLNHCNWEHGMTLLPGSKGMQWPDSKGMRPSSEQAAASMPQMHTRTNTKKAQQLTRSPPCSRLPSLRPQKSTPTAAEQQHQKAPLQG